MATVTFDEVSRIYPNTDRPAVDRISLSIEDGEFLMLVGPSGCGKSTTLRMLAGLEPADEGCIRIDGQDVTQLKPKDRDIAMVFQSYALYPHMTVADNMRFALANAKVPRAEQDARIKEAARMLDLEPYLDRKPKALSGGQRQRVAMGRAVVRQPRVFCMDEPLSNLDAKLRVQTRAEIVAMQRRLAVTTVYVTHDQTEALTMGDRIAVLRGGVLQQIGTPSELYEQPANAFVAGFIGSPAMNLIERPVSEGRLLLGGSDIPVARDLVAGRERIVVGVRPEDLVIAGEGQDGIDLEVDLVEVLGADAYVHAHALDEDGARLDLTVRTDGRRHPAVGDRIRVRPTARHLHFFDPETELRLR